MSCPPFFLILIIVFSAVFGRIATDSHAAPLDELSEEFFSLQRQQMVEEQIKQRGIKDSQVLDAMGKVKRHQFVPPHMALFAYQDSPLPIGYDQTISQPYIVAYMTEALTLRPSDHVLEIGTGSGYQAAILAEIVDQVYSIEIISELAAMAGERLRYLGYGNVTVKQGDGYEGWPEYEPFDAIIVTAAPETIPEKLVDQLKEPGGRMIVPVGAHFQELILVRKTEEGIEKQKLLPVRFVPMVTSDETAT